MRERSDGPGHIFARARAGPEDWQPHSRRTRSGTGRAPGLPRFLSAVGPESTYLRELPHSLPSQRPDALWPRPRPLRRFRAWPASEYRSCRAPTSLPPLVQRTQVVIRVRPVLPDDAGEKEPPAVTCETPTTVQARPLPLRPRSSLAPPSGIDPDHGLPRAATRCELPARPGGGPRRPTGRPTDLHAHIRLRAQVLLGGKGEERKEGSPGAPRQADARGFTFDGCLGPDATQAELFERCQAADLLEVRARSLAYGMVWHGMACAFTHALLDLARWPAPPHLASSPLSRQHPLLALFLLFRPRWKATRPPSSPLARPVQARPTPCLVAWAAQQRCAQRPHRGRALCCARRPPPPRAVSSLAFRPLFVSRIAPDG